MLITVIVVFVIVYLIFHGLHSVFNFRHHYRNGSRGLRLYWNSAQGPYASIRGPFGFRIGHHI